MDDTKEIDWQLRTILKGKGKKGQLHNNIVGILKTGDKREYIYKVSRLPSWRPFWEFLISQTLVTRLPAVKHFARVVDVTLLEFDVDGHGNTLPSTFYSSGKDTSTKTQEVSVNLYRVETTPSSSSRAKSIISASSDTSTSLHTDSCDKPKDDTLSLRTSSCERICMLQKLLYGMTLAKQIQFRCSVEYTNAALCQVLCALECAQRAASFTHFDIHANNVIMVAEKIREKTKQLFYLYIFAVKNTKSDTINNDNNSLGSSSNDTADVDPTDTKCVLLPSFGYRAKIIDFEYAHVKDIDGKPFDSRLDLVGRGYLPVYFDPVFDTIRTTLSTLSYFCDVQRSCKVTRQLLQDLKNRINSNGYAPFVSDLGLTEDEGDRIRLCIRRLAVEQKLDRIVKLVDTRYYHFVGLLLHERRLPFVNVLNIDAESEKSREEHCQTVIDLFKLILELSSQSIDLCHNTLFLYLQSKSDKKSNFFSTKDETWVTKFYFLFKLSTDVLQSLYSLEVTHCIKHRAALAKDNLFRPLAMLDLLQRKIPLQKMVQNGDMIYVMQPGAKVSRVKMQLDVHDTKVLKDFNQDYDIFRRGELAYNIFQRQQSKQEEQTLEKRD